MKEGDVFGELTRLAVALDRGETSLTEFHERLGRSLGKEIPYRELEALVLDTGLRKIPPVWDAVRDIGRSAPVRVAALSNMSREVWKSLQAKFEISSLFSSEILSFELGVSKPDPLIFGKALAIAGASPAESLFVDDTLANVRTAKELGFLTYIARDPGTTARFLRSFGASIRRR